MLVIGRRVDTMINWQQAKPGDFSIDEKETIINSYKDVDGTDVTHICTSETKIINKIIRVYGEVLEVKVDYYIVSGTTGEKIPTQVRVRIPKRQFYTLRSFIE
jgi:isocitrate dehydrogenase